MTKPRIHVLDFHLGELQPGDTGECLTLCGRRMLWIDERVVPLSAVDRSDCRPCRRIELQRQCDTACVQELLGPELFKRYGRYIGVGVMRREPPRSIERAVRALEHDRVEIDAGRCPKCGAPIKRYGADETKRLRSGFSLSHGPRVAPVGDWVMYR